ncbi:isocitrate lyase/PEP mutase family protein [Leekyejoonella antrihumi]|uniref:Isocitrate lyase/phosphoenolpyruvate mutase family protein n=1 Tax=Leekyejoonella antrihumi TaxID=1660198 RepID=A0A563DTS6_9MICO|nr:isocitrate lyase/phosphoenolpyruvate mutase family protein [Leekyejoonella antrihumi]TWP33586.1 isocitrate lyase/phosphoenolpyruvate mutase family protein [Leekyejoonella antrihumi]
MSHVSVDQRRQRFTELHAAGFFLIPNPFDQGSARLLEAQGFSAVATTSSGYAATRGRQDQHVTREELVEHVRAICDAIDVPVNVDSEGCFPGADGGIARTVELLADAGAAGLSIEDFDPVAGQVLDRAEATDRVAEAVAAAHRHGILLTARAENFLHGRADIDDTVARLSAYRDAGADVLYAPGITTDSHIAQVVALGLPVNVLAMGVTPPVPRLRELGVRRVSTGGSLTWAAYGAFVRAATELAAEGTTGYLEGSLTSQQRQTFRDD